MGFAGLRRDEETAHAAWYLASMPADLTGRHVIILEPMVATGGTLTSVIAEVVDRGAAAVVIVQYAVDTERATGRAPGTLVQEAG